MASNFKAVFDGIRGRIEAAIDEIAKQQNFKKYAELAADEIRLRTRLGYGVNQNEGKRQRLKRLAKSTKKSRQYAKNRGELSTKTEPNNSNLTRTAQMLDSLDGKSTGKGKAEVFFHDTRQDDDITNSEVAKFAEQLGRPFLYLTDKEVKRITDEIRKDLIKSVRSRLTK